MLPLIEERRGADDIRGFTQNGNEQGTLVRFGECNFLVQYAPRTPGSPKGGGLVIRLLESRFLLCGLNYSATLLVRPNDLREPDVVSLTEGRFENRELVPGRHLNGDEFHLRFDREPRAVIDKVK